MNETNEKIVKELEAVVEVMLNGNSIPFLLIYAHDGQVISHGSGTAEEQRVLIGTLGTDVMETVVASENLEDIKPIGSA